MRIRIQLFRSMRIRIRGPWFDDQKLAKLYSWEKNQIFFKLQFNTSIFLGLRKGSASYKDKKGDTLLFDFEECSIYVPSTASLVIVMVVNAEK